MFDLAQNVEIDEEIINIDATGTQIRYLDKTEQKAYPEHSDFDREETVQQSNEQTRMAYPIESLDRNEGETLLENKEGNIQYEKVIEI